MNFSKKEKKEIESYMMNMNMYSVILDGCQIEIIS